MGPTEKKSLTQSGTKYIYQYFFLILCFTLIVLLSSFTLFIGEESWREDPGSTLTFFGVIVIINIIILLFLIVGLAYIFNGRREFDDEHESNVILATILLIVYAVLFLINVIYSKGFTGGRAFISAASLGFSSHLPELAITLAISIASHILFGYAMMYLMGRLSSEEQKKRLKKAFYLLVLGNFTLNITGLIAYFMYFKIFQELHLSIKEGKIKAAVTAPCPNCDRDISIESKICPNCGAKFDESNPITIDPRLIITMPKSEYNLPSGYAPIKGPTQAEKNKVIKFVKIIIAIVIAIVAVYIIYVAVSGFLSSSTSGGIDESNFVGTWSGGMFNGTAYLTEENWTFYDNGSLKKEDNFNKIDWNTYEIDNEELCITDPEKSDDQTCYNIEFSSDKTKVTLFLDGTIRYQFTDYTVSEMFDND